MNTLHVKLSEQLWAEVADLIVQRGISESAWLEEVVRKTQITTSRFGRHLYGMCSCSK